MNNQNDKVDLSKMGQRRRSVLNRSTAVREDNIRNEQQSVRTDGVRRKSRLHEDTMGEFFVPPHLIPSGFSVEWKRKDVYGEPDSYYQMELQQQGWRPATVEDGGLGHLVMDRKTENTIVRKGLMLMIRPKELTDEARAEDLEIARSQVRDKIQQLGMTPEGQAPRKVEALNREYQSIPVDE